MSSITEKQPGASTPGTAFYVRGNSGCDMGFWAYGTYAESTQVLMESAAHYIPTSYSRTVESRKLPLADIPDDGFTALSDQIFLMFDKEEGQARGET